MNKVNFVSFNHNTIVNVQNITTYFSPLHLWANNNKTFGGPFNNSVNGLDAIFGGSQKCARAENCSSRDPNLTAMTYTIGFEKKSY